MKKFIKIFTLLGLVFGMGVLLVACGDKVALTKIEGAATQSVEVGETVEVALTVTPENHTDKLVVSVSDETKATAVLEGNKVKVTGVAAGSANVVVSGEKATEVTHTIAVTVIEKEVPVVKHDVKFTVTAPEGTLQVFIIGDMNEWTLSTSPKLTKGTDGKFSITLNIAEGEHEYKFINARDWGFVEKDADGEELENRKVVVNAQGAAPVDTVSSWAKLWEDSSKTLRGVTDTTITVGNTAMTTGALAFVGEPFVAAMEAVFRAVNKDGIHGRTIEFINRSDGGDVPTGVELTKTLVEQDEVFAIVGHFASTVGATLDYLEAYHVPMFYAANGTGAMYAESEPGNPIFAVQPISQTDGRMMLARALTHKIHGAGKDQQLSVATAKIGILYGNDTGSAEMLEGIEIEAKVAGIPTANIHKFQFDHSDQGTMTAAANSVKAANVDVLLTPLSQAQYKAILPAIITSGNTAPVYGSYFVADVTSIPETFNAEFPLFANAWLDITSPQGLQDYLDFAAMINADTVLTAEEKAGYVLNAFAMAGYVAAKMFVDSIKRMGDVATEDFSVGAYIASNETAPFDVPMGGQISYEDGQRIGITDLALLQFVIDGENRSFGKAEEIQSLAELQALYK